MIRVFTLGWLGGAVPVYCNKVLWQAPCLKLGCMVNYAVVLLTAAAALALLITAIIMGPRSIKIVASACCCQNYIDFILDNPIDIV